MILTLLTLEIQLSGYRLEMSRVYLLRSSDSSPLQKVLFCFHEDTDGSELDYSIAFEFVRLRLYCQVSLMQAKLKLEGDRRWLN